MSLSSLITDYDAASFPARSIPPNYKGVSVRGGSLSVSIAATKLPYSEYYEQNANLWAGGYSAVTWMLYIDDFTITGMMGSEVETPDLTIIHPWQNDLIPGAVHREFARPKRILKRFSWIIPAAATALKYDDSGTPAFSGPLERRTIHFQTRIPKVFIDERNALWMAYTVHNPWTAGEPNPDIDVALYCTGAIAYKLRTA